VLEDVFGHLRERVPALVAAAGRSMLKIPKEKIAPYEWELRLLGLLDDLDPKKVLAQDRPDPVLVHVTARRAPHLLQIEPTPPPEPLVAVPAPETAETPPSSDAPVSSEGFFQGLVRRVVELVTPKGPPPDDALTSALSSAITAMKLTGTPVEIVVEARRGRAVRYDGENRRVVVNTSHEDVRALVNHPSRVLVLLAAAVSEVNRELESVTDAEELAVVRDLLRSES
jgi:hypothetical protein